jgi:hypothetical protein
MNNDYGAGKRDNLNKLTIKDYNLNSVNWYLSHFPRHPYRRGMWLHMRRREMLEAS